MNDSQNAVSEERIKKKKHQVLLFCIGLLASFALAIFFIVLGVTNRAETSTIVVCSILTFLGGALFSATGLQSMIPFKNENELQNHINAIKQEQKAKHAVPQDAPIVTYVYRNGPIVCPFTYQTYLSNNKLCFYETDSNSVNASYFDIDVEDIQCFEQTGEVYKETKISGGGGGGSSLAGAVIGGTVAGPIGAVIGSRKKLRKLRVK